jgi:hypothetical protein
MYRLTGAIVLLAIAGLAQQDAAKIEGTTLSADSQPLANVKITLRPGSVDANQKPPSPKTATSDRDGKFSLDGVQPGRYTLVAVLDGYETNLYRPTSGSSTLTLSAGQHMTAVNIKMARLCILSGEVLDEDDKPLPAVTVRPLRRQLGEDGKFQLAVATGRWYVSYSLPRPQGNVKAPRTDEAETGYVKEYYPGVVHAAEALAIDVASGQARPGLGVKLRKARVFHVRGKGAGEMSGDASLSIQVTEAGGDFSEGLFSEGVPFSGDGSFDVAGLPPGSWIFTVARAKGNPVILAQRTVQVGDRNIDGLVLSIRQPVTLTGLLKIVPEPGPNTPPPPIPPRLQVRLTPLDSATGFVSAPVQNDGTFTLAGVGATRYAVDIAAPPGGFVQSISFRGQDALAAGVDLTEISDDLSLQVIISMTSGQVVGSVKVDTGQPPPSTITLMPVAAQQGSAIYRPDLRRSVQSGAAGQFSFTSVVPGRYRVYAWERLDGNLLLDPDSLKLFDSLSTPVTVGESDLQTITVPLISAERMDDEIKRHGR